MVLSKDLVQTDLYTLLGVEEKAADTEVKKAYRQKALSCHPDKNPDNPRAAELFHRLSQALAVLSDAAARAAYDKARKAATQAADRSQKLDEPRKRVKLDLEAGERQAQAQGCEGGRPSSQTLEQELQRLREEGSRQLEPQQRLIPEQARRDRERGLRGETERPKRKGTPTLKVKWKCKEDAAQDGYSRDVLLQLVPKYGDVLNLVLSRKKARTAVVGFATTRAAELAVQNEVGLVDNPLKVSWLEGRPQGQEDPRAGRTPATHDRLRTPSGSDYDSLVMMRMRQAAARQQLIGQMRQEAEGQASQSPALHPQPRS